MWSEDYIYLYCLPISYELLGPTSMSFSGPDQLMSHFSSFLALWSVFASGKSTSKPAAGGIA